MFVVLVVVILVVQIHCIARETEASTSDREFTMCEAASELLLASMKIFSYSLHQKL